MSIGRIGIVVGLEAEAALARPWGLPVVVGGGTPAGARAAADALSGQVDGLISLGLAGGLDPALAAGTLLVPAFVGTGTGKRWQTDSVLNTALGGCTGQVLLGGDRVLATVTEKRAAHAAGYDAIDLESAGVAEIAGTRGLRFAVLRAICDGAARPLPDAALVALDARGRIGGIRVALAALSHLAELPGLIGLARDAARARQALKARVAATTPGQ